jgi:hypothetical protein
MRILEQKKHGTESWLCPLLSHIIESTRASLALPPITPFVLCNCLLFHVPGDFLAPLAWKSQEGRDMFSLVIERSQDKECPPPKLFVKQMSDSGNTFRYHLQGVYFVLANSSRAA